MPDQLSHKEQNSTLNQLSYYI